MAHRQRNPLLRDRDIFIVAIGQLVGMLNPIGIMGLLRGANNAATTTDMQATNAAIADAALVAAASNNSTTAAFSSASATVGLDMYIVLGSGEDIQEECITSISVTSPDGETTIILADPSVELCSLKGKRKLWNGLPARQTVNLNEREFRPWTSWLGGPPAEGVAVPGL